MDDKSIKWVEWITKIFILPILLILSILFVFILITSLLRGNDSGKDNSIFSEKAGEMVDIKTMAKKEDRERFLHYQVVDMPKDSKELIAVRFNTTDEKNIGIIDEHGNVIKEPFLHDSLDCYCGKYDPPLDMNLYYGNYAYIDASNDDIGIYNRDYKRVMLSEEKMEEWGEYVSSKKKSISIDLRTNMAEIEKIYEYFEDPNDYELRYLTKKGENGVYEADIVRPSFLASSSYHIFLDENYELASHLYYSRFETNMLNPPSEDSKIGMVFIENLGMVYFNIDGEIIWITYCDQTTPDQCE